MKEIVLIAELTVDGFFYDSDFGVYMYNIIPAVFPLEIDKTYKTVWDGIEYEHTTMTYTSADGYSCIGYGNALIAGGENTGEPFAVVYNTELNYMHFFSLETVTSHVITICQIEEDANEDEPVGVNLKDRDGKDVIYEGVQGVRLFGTDGNVQTFIKGEVTDIEVELDMVDGSQVITAPDGEMYKNVIVKKPDALVPENILKDVNIGGVIGIAEVGGGAEINLLFKYAVNSTTMTYSSSASVTINASVQLPLDATIQKILIGTGIRSGTASSDNSTPPITEVIDATKGSLFTKYTVTTGADAITVSASYTSSKAAKRYGGMSMVLIVLYTV